MRRTACISPSQQETAAPCREKIPNVLPALSPPGALPAITPYLPESGYSNFPFVAANYLE
jgi:hypothetical protein